MPWFHVHTENVWPRNVTRRLRMYVLPVNMLRDILSIPVAHLVHNLFNIDFFPLRIMADAVVDTKRTGSVRTPEEVEESKEILSGLCRYIERLGKITHDGLHISNKYLREVVRCIPYKEITEDGLKAQ